MAVSSRVLQAHSAGRAPTYSSRRLGLLDLPRTPRPRKVCAMPRNFIGHQPLKGRGAASNPTGRFDALIVEKADDGWYQDETPDIVGRDGAAGPRPRHHHHQRFAGCGIRAVDQSLSRLQSWLRLLLRAADPCLSRPVAGAGFRDQALLQGRRGQAFSRPSSPSRSYVCKPIALGINTDGYQPLEKKLEVTRGILAVLARCRHPVTIVTKSALILRDLDLLADLAKDRLVSVMVSITSLDRRHQAHARAAHRLAARAAAGHPAALRRRAFRVGVLVAPVIPAITDHEMEDILGGGRRGGRDARAGYVLLRLPHELKIIFREWLADHYPDRAAHVMSLINQARGGKDYDSQFGVRMRGTGAYAELLRARFDLAVRKLGSRRPRRSRYELDSRNSGRRFPPAARCPWALATIERLQRGTKNSLYVWMRPSRSSRDRRARWAP